MLPTVIVRVLNLFVQLPDRPSEDAALGRDEYWRHMDWLAATSKKDVNHDDPVIQEVRERVAGLVLSCRPERWVSGREAIDVTNYQVDDGKGPRFRPMLDGDRVYYKRIE